MHNLRILSRSSLNSFDTLGHPVWIFSQDTFKIIFSNVAAQNWLGYGKEELESISIFDIRPEGDHPALLRQLRNFSEETVKGGTWTIVTKSGEHRKASFGWHKVSLEGAVAVVATISDTTSLLQTKNERARLEGSLNDLRLRNALSEDAFRRLFEAAPGKMLVLTPGNHEIVAVTDEYAAATMTDRAALYGRNLFDAFPGDPDDPEADGARNLKASLHRVEILATVDVMSVQKYPIRRPDGGFEVRYWMPVNKPVIDGSGEILYIIHRVEDVTDLIDTTNLKDVKAGKEDVFSAYILLRFAELRSSMNVLQEREARLRAAERLLDLGTWEYDLKTRALSWSSRVFSIYGVSAAKGSPHLDAYVALVHPDDREDMIANYDRFHSSQHSQIEFQHRVIREDGSIAHVRGVGERIPGSNSDIVVGFVQDISDLVDAQVKLTEVTRLQRIASQIVKLGSWRLIVDPMKLYWSSETKAIHGVPPDTEPTVEQALDYYVPEHRSIIRDAVSACMREGHPFDEVLQIVTAQGSRAWVRAVGEAVFSEEGTIVAVEGAFQEIGELISAREEVETLSRRLRQTLENISDAFFLLDDDWRFSFVNQQAEVLLRRSRGELVGKNIWDEFPSAVGSRFQSLYVRAVETGQKGKLQEFFPPLGSWFAVDAYPTTEGLAVYFRDITEDRKREEQLRLLENAVSRQNDILVITDFHPIDGPHGPKIVYVNDAFIERTGYSRDEVIGRTPRILQGPKTQRSELDKIRRALERSQPVRSELINYTKSGEEIWLEIDIVPLSNEAGEFTHCVAVERDITARKISEELIRVNNERFLLVAKATNDVIWDWDLTKGTLWWNDNLKTMFGYDPGQIEPGPESWVTRIHPEDRDRVLESIHSVIDGAAEKWISEYRFINCDGIALTVIDRGFVIRNEDGIAVRMLGSMSDMTSQREMENTLRQSQKLEAVGQLTGGVAHDFNNLLTVILGNAQLLQMHLRDNPELRLLADMSETAAERGAELTSRLLAFSRKQALEPRLLDINALIVGMEALLRRALGEHISIRIDLAQGLWFTEVDPGQLESALLNLALNGRDAMLHGGALTIETANTILDEEYARSEPGLDPGEYVSIVVSDTGHGIPEKILARIFEPFFTTKEVGKGSGLGLSMVYGFIKQSGGHIRIYSEVDEGTSVRLYFPRSFEKSAHAQKSKSQERVSGGKECILVVEDDAMVREHVIAQLKGLGYHVVSASAGQEALEVLRQVPEIDLLFTDVVMPGGMNGRALADAAKAMRPELKILFTSGYSESAITHQGRLDPGVALLSKPYRREQLAGKVRELLERP